MLITLFFFFFFFVSAYVVACFEKNYRRMKALTKMGTSAHREEVITGNLSDYLVTGGFYMR